MFRASVAAGFLVAPAYVFAFAVSPPTPIQGEAILLRFSEPVSQVRVAGGDAPMVHVGTSSVALYAFGLTTRAGSYPVSWRDMHGARATSTIFLTSRTRSSATMDIPKKLGGTTAKNAKRVVSLLEKENTKIMSLRSHTKQLWSEAFILPLLNPVVTDPYGYIRETAGAEITHKGTDYRAAVGTPVMAMNRGIVRMVRASPVYGKTIVVDHGQGLFTLYMHLSRISVSTGELIERGSVIGKSGATGYAEHPHLHVSVRLSGESVDPVAFLKLFE